MKIRLVISGRSYDVTDSLPEEIHLADGASVDDAICQINAALPEGQTLPGSCLLAVAGNHLGTLAAHQDVVLHDGEELILITPVAGG